MGGAVVGLHHLDERRAVILLVPVPDTRPTIPPGTVPRGVAAGATLCGRGDVTMIPFPMLFLAGSLGPRSPSTPERCHRCRRLGPQHPGVEKNGKIVCAAPPSRPVRARR
jgi:hypothetical protein